VITARVPHFVDAFDVRAFDKGNLHTHSLESDGDAPPEEVYRFYRDHGYQFLALTDHNHVVQPRTYRHLERPRFKMLPAEEVTMTAEGREVHVNALCIKKKIDGGTFATKKQALEHAIDATHAQGGIALINHPNFGLALNLNDLVDGGRHADLLELWSGHPYVYPVGVDGAPSYEALWDAARARGVAFSGVGVDDAHHFHVPATSRTAAAPLRAWIATYAEPGADVDATAICDAIKKGRFYASNGVQLTRLLVGGKSVQIWPKDPEARVFFVGDELGELPPQAVGPDGSARYELDGHEKWIRARVEDSRGKRAWTQAFTVGD
jgi:hypothetical protein